MSDILTCKRPDRDCPGIVCGYPLPCPHHTFILDVEKQTVEVPKNAVATTSNIARLRKVNKALDAKGGGGGGS